MKGKTSVVASARTSFSLFITRYLVSFEDLQIGSCVFKNLASRSRPNTSGMKILQKNQHQGESELTTNRRTQQPSANTTLAKIFFLTLAASPLVAQQTKTLLATPDTIVWGAYGGALKPALTVHSGDTVTIQTLSTCG